MLDLPTDEAADALLDELGRKYVWWRPIGGVPHSRERIIAQIMNLGTYADIRRLEAEFAPETLAHVARRSAAGWLSPRSWEFWRGRLATANIKLPEAPPRRSFGDEHP